MAKTVYIETYGCQMNVADSKTVTSIVQSSEFLPVTDINKADVIILNTCSVRENAEKKIWNRLEHLKGFKRKNNSLKIGVIGCMAQRAGEELLQHGAVSFVAGPDSYRNLPDIINEVDIDNKIRSLEFNTDENYSGIDPEKTDDSISGFISITRGCDNFCSYCIVPYTRGRERSRDYIEIINEAEALHALGSKEITLLGQNVNSYLFEKGNKQISFPELISMVSDAVPDVRIRFTTSHPKDLSDELIITIAEKKNICEHIHLPVQSGSNKVLELMNRKYTREWYLNRIETIKRIIPDCGLSTDVFCGFPGENEYDFEQTVDLMNKVRFDSAFMFKYSERPGTYAAKHYKDDVDEKAKTARLNKIIQIQNQISLENNQKDIGKKFEVLVEGFSKKSKNMLFGRTPQNKVAVFDKKNAQKGDIVKVQIIEVSSATLKAEII